MTLEDLLNLARKYRDRESEDLNNIGERECSLAELIQVASMAIATRATFASGVLGLADTLAEIGQWCRDSEELDRVYDLVFHAGEVDADKTAAQKVESLVRHLDAADALIAVVMQWAGFDNPTPEFRAGSHGNLFAAVDRYRAAMGLPASMNAESKAGAQ